MKYCFISQISSFINIACQKSGGGGGGGAMAPWCSRACTAGKDAFYYILLYILKLKYIHRRNAVGKIKSYNN